MITLECGVHGETVWGNYDGNWF